MRVLSKSTWPTSRDPSSPIQLLPLVLRSCTSRQVVDVDMNQMKAFIVTYAWMNPSSKEKGVFVKKKEKKLFGCFPSNAFVRVNNDSVRISSIRVAEVVDTGPGKTAEVYMFSHRKFDGIFEFVALHTQDGNLTASPGHHISTQHGDIPARDVKPGDLLTTPHGSQKRVIHIQRVYERGLFNPHTMDGSIDLNGFVVSTFTDAVPQNAASSLLAPIRAAYMASNSRDLTMVLWKAATHFLQLYSVPCETLYFVMEVTRVFNHQPSTSME